MDFDFFFLLRHLIQSSIKNYGTMIVSWDCFRYHWVFPKDTVTKYHMLWGDIKQYKFIFLTAIEEKSSRSKCQQDWIILEALSMSLLKLPFWLLKVAGNCWSSWFSSPLTHSLHGKQASCILKKTIKYSLENPSL